MFEQYVLHFSLQHAGSYKVAKIMHLGYFTSS